MCHALNRSFHLSVHLYFAAFCLFVQFVSNSENEPPHVFAESVYYFKHVNNLYYYLFIIIIHLQVYHVQEPELAAGSLEDAILTRIVAKDFVA
jgi:hypothetical protein